jgi:hypothetical protein
MGGIVGATPHPRTLPKDSLCHYHRSEGDAQCQFRVSYDNNSTFPPTATVLIVNVRSFAKRSR